MKNSKLLIGSVVYGAAGIGCKVLAVEGDTLTVETPNGTRTISSSKVVRVNPPTTSFKIGDRVKYIGSHFHLQKIYAGILEVCEVSLLDGYSCLKPDEKLTSWIDFQDLEDAIK